MPMSWNADNDRILLLKLIEIHGISPNCDEIAEKWPAGSIRPSGRAIKERFVKLRQLAGISGSSSTPGRATGKAVTPRGLYNTPRKRKTTKKDSSDESDTEDDITDHEGSPKKKQSVQRSGGTRGRGSARRGLGSRGGLRATGSPGPRIKTEIPPPNLLDLPALPDDPFDDEDKFEKDAREAKELRNSARQDPLGKFRGFRGSSRVRTLSGFGKDNATTFNNGFDGPSMRLEDPFSVHNSPSNGVSSGMQGTVSRLVPTRKASAQAAEEVATLLRLQKYDDLAQGDKSSDEDSQASSYKDLDGDFI